jgi:hypothetical protein
LEEALIIPRKVLFFVLLTSAGTGLAAATAPRDIYFAQNAVGSNNGSSCANAYAWNDGTYGWNVSGQQAAGNTLHVCGTITVSSGKNAITFVNSGTSGNPITLRFEANAILQAPYFGTGGNAAININGKSYITIDGGSNGIVMNYANGTAGSNSCPGINNTGGGSCSNQQASSLIQADCATGCEIKGLTLGPDYLRTSQGDATPCAFSNEGAIFISGSSASDNFLIHDNTIHDGRWINTFEFGNGSNFQFYNNTVYASGHAIAVEISANSNFDGMYFYGNHIYDFTEWGGNSCFHNNSIHVFQTGANTTGTITHLFIYNNEFDGSLQNSTNHIYLEPNGSVNSVGSAWIFNNILSFAGDETGGDGILGATAGSSSVFVANNTFIGNASNQSSPTQSCGGSNEPLGSTTWTNNISVACSTMWSGTNKGSGGPSFATGQPDYNLWAVGVGNGWQCDGAFYSTISGWRGCIGNEIHSQYFSSSPLPECNGIHDCSNVRPEGGSSAIGFGTSLNSACAGQPTPGLGALCYDKPQNIGPGSGSTIGTLRPTSGAWDAGAYQYAVSSSQPAPPSGLVATVN